MRKYDFSYAVRTRDLYKILGFRGGKIPLNFSGNFPKTVCPVDLRGNTVTLDIEVTLPPRPGLGKHRILARCPKCGVKRPIGRLAQHINTAICRSEERKLDEALQQIAQYL